MTQNVQPRLVINFEVLFRSADLTAESEGEQKW